MKNLLRIVAAAGLCALAACGTSENGVTFVERPDMEAENSYYPGNRAPLQRGAFIKLPLGAVEPQGWPRELLERQANGLAGHLGEISAWLDKENNAWLDSGTPAKQTQPPRWMAGWEELPYWLRGYSDMAFMLGDKEMIAETMVWLDAIFETQGADGWIGPVHKPVTDAREVWPNMLILYTMQHYYEYSKDPRALELLERYYKYQLAVPEENLLAGWGHLRGGDNLYCVLWFYNQTGEPWVLELAEKLRRRTARWTHGSDLPTWHNVNIAQGFREPATYFLLSADSADLQASYNNHTLVRRTHGQVPGGMFGADEVCRLGRIDPHQAVETCGFAEQMTSDGILTRITGDTFWADNCEDVMFNSFPSAFTPDMRSLRYLTAPNMVLNDVEDHAPGVHNGGPFLMMNPFSFRCCQHNHGHAVPYYVQNMVMASNDNGLLANLYGPCTTVARVGDDGVEVTLREITQYPFEEGVLFDIWTEQDVTFPFYLRIPGWCEGATVHINGKNTGVRTRPGGYVRIERTWSDGDVVELMLPMRIEVREWEVNRNSVSVNHGPLTFSLLIEENYVEINGKEHAMSDARWREDSDEKRWPAYEIHPGSAWNYGLLIDPKRPESSFTVERRAYPASGYPFLSEDAPVIIRARGKKIPEWQLDEHGLCAVVPISPVATAEPVEELTLVPMGGARLRISAFPTVR